MEKQNISSKVAPIDRNANYQDFAYEENFLGLSTLPPNLLIFGGTNSGKTTILLNLLLKKLIHEFEPQNIYLFSQTAEDLDDSYRPFYLWCCDRETPINIYKEPNIEVIERIVKQQRDLGRDNMLIDDSTKLKKVPKYLFIYDDVIGSSQTEGRTSKLSNFAAYNRHANVHQIYLFQDYNAASTRVRRNTGVYILCSCDSYPESMIDDISLTGYRKPTNKVYDQMSHKKDYSFIVVNRMKTLDKRLLFVSRGCNHCYIDPKSGEPII